MSSPRLCHGHHAALELSKCERSFPGKAALIRDSVTCPAAGDPCNLCVQKSVSRGFGGSGSITRVSSQGWQVAAWSLVATCCRATLSGRFPWPALALA